MYNNHSWIQYDILDARTQNDHFHSWMQYDILDASMQNNHFHSWMQYDNIRARMQLWISLENTRKYQWDTLHFESQEETRQEFIESAEIQRDEEVDPVSAETVCMYACICVCMCVIWRLH
jgi:hypothetical protein